LRLHNSIRTLVRDRRAGIAAAAGKLETLSPLAVLGRGYSLTSRASDGRLVRTSADIRAGDEIVTRFHQGSARSVVQKLEP
jgi:exodeoxyribonuclease VII large subunit